MAHGLRALRLVSTNDSVRHEGIPGGPQRKDSARRDAADFVDHLAALLGVERSTALFCLGDWLSRYQPMRPREIRFGPVPE